MNAEQIRPRGSHWTIVAIVMLAFAVFSWGIRYKLSLYNPAAHMSAAKLLSQRERPATSEASELAADPLANPAPITLFGLALGVTLVGLFSLKPTFSKRNVWDRVQLPKRSGQNFFFFRPPPLLYSL